MARNDPYGSGGDDVAKALKQFQDMAGGGDAQPKQSAAAPAAAPTQRRTRVLDAYTPKQQANAPAAATPPNVGAVGSGSLDPNAANAPNAGAPIAYQPVTGNSLDQILRSLMNLIGGQGFSASTSGSQVLGTGLNAVQAGLNLQQMPAEFWQQILSGDPAASKFIQQAMAPQVAGIGDQYAAVEHGASTGMPLGGYRATSIADAPAAQARDVSGIYAQFASLVPQAAEQLSSIGTSIANTGMGVGNLGVNEQSQGIQQLIAALNAALGKSTINQQQSTANLGMLSQGLTSLASSLI